MYQELLKKDNGLNFLKERFKDGNDNHAFILQCKDSILYDGMFGFFATYALNGDIGGELYDKITKKVCPDVYFFPSDGRQKIAVADIEVLIRQSATSPLSEKKKIFCIDASGGVREDWQNKLLKILEEPPKNVIIAIACINAEELLMTVKSRCQVTNIGCFDTETIADFLNKRGAPKEKAAVVARLAGGSAGKATYIADTPFYLGCIDDMSKMLVGLKTSKDIVLWLPIIAKYKEKYEDMLEIIQNLLFDAVLLDAKGCEILNLSKKDDIIQIAASYTPAAVTKIISLTERAKTMLDNYVGFNTVTDNLLLNILEVKYRCRQ